VHLEEFPSSDRALIHPELEEAVKVMDALVMLGRNQREKIGVKAKIPLKHLRIIQRDKRVLETLAKFEPYFVDELNVMKVEYASNEDEFVQVTTKANFPVLGKRVGPKMKQVAAAIQALPLSEILKLEAGQSVTVEGEAITLADVEIRRAAKGTHPNLAVHQVVSIELDPTVDPEQMREGLAREVLRKIQQARKNAGFKLNDRIRLELAVDGVLKEGVAAHRKMIEGEALITQFEMTTSPQGSHVETVELEEGVLVIGVTVV
jgi:isoleucyl-tRNA synthetase